MTEKAIESCEKALLLKPNGYEAWNNKGTYLIVLGHYEEALKSFEEAILIYPNYYEAWNNRGLCLHELGHYQEAIKSFDQAIVINPALCKSWKGRGHSIRVTEGYEQEIANYQESLIHFTSPTHAKSLGGICQCIGRANYKKGKNDNDRFRLNSRIYYEKALSAFKEAAITLIKFPEPYIELTQDFMKIYLSLRKPEIANIRTRKRTPKTNTEQYSILL